MTEQWHGVFDAPRCVVCDAPPVCQITMQEAPHGFGRYPKGPVAKTVHTCDAHYNDVLNEMTRQRWDWHKIERIGEEARDD